MLTSAHEVRISISNSAGTAALIFTFSCWLFSEVSREVVGFLSVMGLRVGVGVDSAWLPMGGKGKSGGVRTLAAASVYKAKRFSLMPCSAVYAPSKGGFLKGGYLPSPSSSPGECTCQLFEIRARPDESRKL